MTHRPALTRREILALGGAALTGAAFSPRPASAQAPKRGGTLVTRGWDPPHFDPMLTSNFKTHTALSFTHSRLVKHKAGPSVTPGTFLIEGDLAESWTQPDDTTYVFKLRRGVRWQAKPPVNGRELTAEDVRYTVERFKTITGNAYAYMLRAVEKVEAPDKYTVKFTLKEPFVWFLDMLANPMAVAIVARECVEKFGFQGKFDSMAFGPQTSFLEPDGYLYGEYMPGEPRNQSHITDPVVTDLIVRQRRTSDVVKRRELIHEIQRHLAKQQYYVQIHSGLSVAAWENAVKNYAPNLGFDLGGRLTAAWLER